jgi:16S rRNA (guanine966-N2)-methyltransferase
MRVIAGSARGKLLKSLRGSNVRPTSSKVKAAFFNMVADNIVEARFLDLFAGTGGIGIEALSRGAKECVFVEKNYSNMQLLRENLQLTNMLEYAEIFHCDYKFAIRVLAKRLKIFDLIYIDPPYHYGEMIKILLLLEKEKLLAPGGIIGVERDSRRGAKLGDNDNISPFLLVRKKKYGGSLLLLYKNVL